MSNMQRGKKKLPFFILILVVAVGVLCYIGLDYDSPVRHEEGFGIYRASLDSESTIVDFTDTGRLGLFAEFYTYDFFRYLSFDMNVTVVDGNVYAVIYDITDTPYTQEVAELTEVARKTMGKSGDYSMALKELPENRQYVIGFFCDESCMFTLDGSFSWTTSMKEYIQDVWLAGIFKQEEQYTPKNYPENEW
ncbi:MAG: hypothetical protein K2K56_10655 [Lachnospiraceae bacterium]|nr:hypothetical protein [Lachnospiraceae bacterium]